jgi:hypothetical protein
MFLFLFFYCCFSIDMNSFYVEDDRGHPLKSRDTISGTSCQAPGGILNQMGDCVCCGGWSGPGCSRRNKCFETSCSNGGHCDPDSGFCMCPITHTGPQCEHPSCSFKGYYEKLKKRCICNNGYSGTDCEQCATSPVGQSYTCVPSKSHLHDGYMLLLLPSDFSSKIISGEKKPDPTLNYNGIYPNSIGKDGKKYGCDCRLDNGDGNKKRWISNGNLQVYNQTIVECISESTLSSQQMIELTNMWYTAYTLEQQGRLNDTWYIIGIIFIVFFILETLCIIIYCFVKNYDSQKNQDNDGNDNVDDVEQQLPQLLKKKIKIPTSSRTKIKSTMYTRK